MIKYNKISVLNSEKIKFVYSMINLKEWTLSKEDWIFYINSLDKKEKCQCYLFSDVLEEYLEKYQGTHKFKNKKTCIVFLEDSLSEKIKDFLSF